MIQPFHDLVTTAPERGWRWHALNSRPAGCVAPAIARMFATRPAWPLVKYDPEFAAWQACFPVQDAAWHFQRIKQMLA